MATRQPDFDISLSLMSANGIDAIRAANAKVTTDEAGRLGSILAYPYVDPDGFWCLKGTVLTPDEAARINAILTGREGGGNGGS